jgi:hypothetical protein
MKQSLLFQPAVNIGSTDRLRFEANSLLCLALGSAFLGTGIAKIAATGFVIDTFAGSNLAPALLVAIGLIELAAAILTIIPTTRLLGTGLISTIMLGAIGYHSVRGEFLLMAIPVAALLASLTVSFLELTLRRSSAAVAPVYAR